MLNIPMDIVRSARDWVVGHREPELPRPTPTPQLAAKWLVDEYALQFELWRPRWRLPDDAFRRRTRDELGDAVDMYNAKGWVHDPRSYHRTPTAPRSVDVTHRNVLGLDFEHISFESRFEPHPGEPGRDRWLGYEKNRTAHAWVLRHKDGPRPWLICVNGYRTGSPLIDFVTFNARRLHLDYGLNLAFPVQPLHGPRAHGRSGDRVMHSGAMNLIYTGAQGLWDIRRLKAWIQTRNNPTAVGIMGISLGGYFTALTASFEDDLACAIAGVPEPDLVRGQRRHAEPLLPPWYELWGLSWRSLERANRVVSPLWLEPAIDRDRRFIFGGLADRWVRPGNVQALWEHWDRPEILWYEGSHLSFLIEPSVRRFVRDALAQTIGIEGPEQAESTEPPERHLRLA